MICIGVLLMITSVLVSQSWRVDVTSFKVHKETWGPKNGWRYECLWQHADFYTSHYCMCSRGK